jgi:hypothetical protein
MRVFTAMLTNDTALVFCCDTGRAASMAGSLRHFSECDATLQAPCEIAQTTHWAQHLPDERLPQGWGSRVDDDRAMQLTSAPLLF